MRRWTRRRVLNLGLAIGAVVVVILLLLVAFGYLAVPSSSVGQVTLYEIRWTVHQGTTSSGQGWFGPSQFNYSLADGYPVKVAPGETLTIPWAFSNYDVTNHTIIAILVGAPFTFVRTLPALPAVVPSGTDDAFLSVAIRAPSIAGLNITLTMTVEVA